jgi:type II secretory pathway component GspD/PulD (secretin)
MNFVQMVSDKDATAEASKASKSTGQGQIGTIVRRNADGTMNVSEPIGDFNLRGPEEVVTVALKTLEQIDIGPERIDRVVKLHFLKADDVLKQLDQLYSAKGLQTILAPSQDIQEFTKPGSVEGSEKAGGGGGAAASSAATDEIANLVLRGPEEVVAQAVQLIEQMDIEPPQISLNAQIVSVSMDSERALGVQWPGSVTTKLNEQQSGKAFQFGRIVRDPISLQVTLNALESQHKAKIISRPASVVKNGRTSFIHVGKLVTYDTFKGLDATGNKVFSTDTLTTGVTMYVRPIVSPDGIITLDIMSGVTDDPIFRVSASGSDLPQVNETATTTTVQVRDGETLVIGGLTQQKQEETRTGVPILSRIPLVGALFTNKSVKPAQSELLIMVTPSIVKPGTTPAPAGLTAPAQ